MSTDENDGATDAVRAADTFCAMAFGRGSATWVATTLLVVALLTGCGDGSDDASAETSEVVATIAGRTITLADVEELATDGGFLQLIKQDEVDGELVGSPAGRAALARLLAERAVAAALDDAGIDVTDEIRSQATDAVGASERLGDRAREVLIDGLAEYLTIDRALRDGTGGPTLEASGIMERFPSLSTRYCGPSLAVEPDVADEVDAALISGVGLADVALPDGMIASTGDGLAECGLEVGVPAAARRVIVDVPDGEIAKATARRASNGETVVVYAQPTNEGPGEAADVERASAAFDERLRSSGHTAWWEVVGPQLDVSVDAAWGVWGGTSLLDAAAEPEIVTPTGTTTTAPPATTVPATPPSTAGTSGPTLSEQLFTVTDPGTADPLARGSAALTSSVPTAWHDAIPVTLSEIPGTTSLSYTDGRIELGTYHLTGTWGHLQDVTAHEFGHQIAYNFGTQAELGAAPEGWPVSGSTPVERWADCVSRSFSGIASGSHGMAACDGSSYEWTYAWLAPGPDAHPRTR